MINLDHPSIQWLVPKQFQHSQESAQEWCDVTLKGKASRQKILDETITIEGTVFYQMTHYHYPDDESMCSHWLSKRQAQQWCDDNNLTHEIQHKEAIADYKKAGFKV